MDTQKSSDIRDNSSNYLCEKSTEWIKDNCELVNKAKYIKREFKDLINKLKISDKLTNEERRIYL